MKKYKKDTLTINWEPEKCIHSTKCWRGETGLPTVFNPKEKPWIKPEKESIETIIAHIKQCPSGALSYSLEDEKVEVNLENQATNVTVLANGPLLCSGNITIVYPDGRTEEKQNNTALCRCGASANKPFCDGNHNKIGFKG
ncbi:(4Fe-4S)-binding protein [Flavobacterium sp. CBA20B-1]|uniref:(4Fe-4S)-binding protein n=1 Tax=unclassified Flavobacterium TaxID=196869 RepID=UPI0022258BE4|nr:MULTISPECIES: (4Fe-4S)-binding protein [unclassified Flavobacterium]WCM42597.1 (4Fe-4S)-binding protein [Flavobacterium sp. CBA20B-1]